jgi:hypothetical protein
MTLNTDNLAPNRLMSAAELKQAERLLRRLDRHFAAQKKDELRPKDLQLGYSHWQVKREAIGSEIDILAATVLERELALARYMVVHVRRNDGYEATLQVLQFGFTRMFAWNRWGWCLEGRSLRKNGTLGERPNDVCFDDALINKRRIDGVWEPLSLSKNAGIVP